MRGVIFLCLTFTGLILTGSGFAQPTLGDPQQYRITYIAPGLGQQPANDLAAVLPSYNLSQILDDTGNRSGTSSASHCPVFVLGLIQRFCWDNGDALTRDWYPQGITTTGDAEGNGLVSGRVAVAVSWYSKAQPGKGVRVSFIDWEKPTLDYRHVLLVEPYWKGNPRVMNFRHVNVHAGGIAWYKHWLYVPDTSNGLRVFDTRRFFRVKTGDKNLFGLTAKGYQAHDYKYVLPQVHYYKERQGYRHMQWSFVSIDRTSTQHALIAGEYCVKITDSCRGVVVRYSLDPNTGKLVGYASGDVKPSGVWNMGIPGLNGAASLNGIYFMAQNDIDTTPPTIDLKGDMAIFKVGLPLRWRADSLPILPEDLSYWPGRRTMFSLNELPGSRYVFSFNPSAW